MRYFSGHLYPLLWGDPGAATRAYGSTRPIADLIFLLAMSLMVVICGFITYAIAVPTVRR